MNNYKEVSNKKRKEILIKELGKLGTKLNRLNEELQECVKINPYAYDVYEAKTNYITFLEKTIDKVKKEIKQIEVDELSSELYNLNEEIERFWALGGMPGEEINELTTYRNKVKANLEHVKKEIENINTKSN